MVNWPVSDDVAELVADTTLLFYLPIFPTSLPTSHTPNDTLRYNDTRRF